MLLSMGINVSIKLPISVFPSLFPSFKPLVLPFVKDESMSFKPLLLPLVKDESISFKPPFLAIFIAKAPTILSMLLAKKGCAINFVTGILPFFNNAVILSTGVLASKV